MDRVKLVAFLESERRLNLPQRRLNLPQFYQLSKTNPKFKKNFFPVGSFIMNRNLLFPFLS